jgi:hypothetical protein
LRDGGVEAAESGVDVGGGEGIDGKGLGEFGAEAFGFKLLEFSAGMEEAEIGMGGMAQHAVVATVGERELPKAGFSTALRSRDDVDPNGP